MRAIDLRIGPSISAQEGEHSGPKDLSLRAVSVTAVVVATLTLGSGRASAQDAVVPLAMPEGNLAAVGVGAYPDYLGSNDYSIGAVPLVRYQYWGGGT